MARPKKKDENDGQVPAKVVNIDKFFAEVDKLNPDGCVMVDDVSLSTATDWISTGSYALNAILSGNIHKGIPRGRVVGFAGENATGKSMIISKILKNAQDIGYYPVVWDSENAFDKDSAVRAGINPEKMRRYPIDTIERCREQICKLLDDIVATNSTDLKIIIAIDSIANLSSSKEVADISAGKDANDMGMRAKTMKSMLRTLTHKAAKANVPIVFTNHVYANPAAMFPSLVKEQGGGSGPMYMSSILVQLAKNISKAEDREDEKSIAIAHKVSGVNLTAMTTKNRFVPPFLKTELYLNFKTGLDKYTGLADMAEAFGIVFKKEGSGHRFFVEGSENTIGFRSDWEKNPEFWDKTGLTLLQKKLESELQFSSNSNLIDETLETNTDEDIGS